MRKWLAIAAALFWLGCDAGSNSDAAGIDADELEALRALGYVDVGEPLAPDIEVGVSKFDRRRARRGLNLYTNSNGCRTILMDMQGEALHSWSHQPCFRWENTVLLPDGDLLTPVRITRAHDLASAEKSRYLMRLGWDNTIRWSLLLPVHHDVEMTPSGRILVMGHRLRSIPELNPSIITRDHLLILISPDGHVLEELSLWDAIADSPGMLTVTTVQPREFEGTEEIDIFHSNSVEWMRHPELVERNPIYAENNVLICIRNQDAIVILDWQQKKIVWSWGPGELSGPHDATLLPNGNILVFDNGVRRRWSRVIELDPIAREIVWEYRAEEPESFHTAMRGASQRLDNGNTLITESESGRVFEVDPGGEIVWEFRNPEMTRKREPAVIVRTRRLEGIDYETVLARLKAETPLPWTD